MSDKTTTEVIDCIAQVTRYPHDLLQPDADLENDLGIDSVKRLEIQLALAEKFGFDSSQTAIPESIRTIASLSQWLSRNTGPSTQPVTADAKSVVAAPTFEPERESELLTEPAPEQPKPALMSGASSGETSRDITEIQSVVVDCFATCTKYPIELLDQHADIENDLGIDSVKQLEVALAIEERMGVRLPQEEAKRLHTIAQISDWILNQSADSAEGQNVETSASTQDNELMHQSKASSSSDEETQQTSRRADPPQELRGPRFPSRADSSQSVSTPASEQHRHAGNYRELDGQVVLVTGGGRGVGLTISKFLAASGATVLVNSFHSREQGEETAANIRASGGQAEHLWGSIANPDHVDRMFEQITSVYGRLDALVCNASDGRIGSFSSITPDDWDRAFRTNVVGHHQCAVRASKIMHRTGGGAIVTMSAVGANGFIEGLGSQGVVKAAVETMTKYLACELGPLGIRTNCIVGGPVYGELLSKFPDAQAAQNHWESFTPDGQLCSPIDLAKVVQFLISDNAAAINGCVWNVDHGFSAVADGRPRQIQIPAGAMLALEPHRSHPLSSVQPNGS